MDLEQLRAFLAVVETGSFLTAARLLKMSRATLRRRIDELEARAGLPLLERTRTGALLTEPGRLLASRGRLLVEEAGARLHSVRETGSSPAGLLRLKLPVGLPPYILNHLFALVHARYPRLRFRLHFSDDPTGGLLEDVDLAFHFGARSPQGPWTSHELMGVGVHLIASAEYLRARGAPAQLTDLDSHPLLVWAPPGEDGRSLPLRVGGNHRVEPLVIATDVHLLRQYALAGFGVALVPDAALPDPQEPPGAVLPVLPDVVGGEVPLRVVVPSALVDIPRVKALLDLIRPYAKTL